jgi:FPC/CPF motif-containing protein YcgG
VQEVIRNRERNLQGNLNPNLADFGTRSEARQYSGRPVEEGWRCPFHALEGEDLHRAEGIPGYRRKD